MEVPGRSGGRVIAVLIVASSLRSARTSLSCGPAAGCGDVASSLVETLILEGLRLSGSTDHEDSTVAWYEIWRYDCGNPQQCSVYVTTRSALGVCETLEEYDETDDPPRDAEDWTYVVEVWTTGDQRACAVDLCPSSFGGGGRARPDAPYHGALGSRLEVGPAISAALPALEARLRLRAAVSGGVPFRRRSRRRSEDARAARPALSGPLLA